MLRPSLRKNYNNSSCNAYLVSKHNIRIHKPYLQSYRNFTETNNHYTCLFDAARNILQTESPEHKAIQTHSVYDQWKEKKIKHIVHPDVAKQLNSNDIQHYLINDPGRPEKPEIVAARDSPSPKKCGVSVPVYLLHSLAHIEVNAIDIAWSTLIMGLIYKDRYNLPEQYFINWLNIADDESRHFEQLENRMKELGTSYGSIPSHGGLWQNAKDTSDDLLSRMAILPLVQEARGVDSGPRLKERFIGSADKTSAKLVEQISREEEDHVSVGVRWFNHICNHDSLDPQETFQKLVLNHYQAGLPPQFNVEGRDRAGLPREWYEPLSTRYIKKKERKK
eukprot:gb/GECH01008967.1/.p1 GENE.gb/GECH01008967.1/~~gb/GECH01008967.1/.p1  ORF type:complete len:335 (+),score=70.53 gb/GECH01008967.1/:1-1005(+)